MRPLSVVLRDQRGFTLTELLVTVAIVGLIMTAVLNVQMSGTTISQTGSNKAEAQQAARAAVMMDEDLRGAGYGYPPSLAQITPPAGPNITAAIIVPNLSPNCIAGASPTCITFMADVENASTTVSAAVNSGDKSVDVISPGSIVAGDTIFLINGSQAATLTVKNVVKNAPPAPDKLNLNTNVICPGILNPCYPVGAVVGRARAITYSWNAATLTLSKDAGDGVGLQPLATGVQAFQLRYWGTNDDGTNATEILPANLAANLANIRRVLIQITAQSATAQNRGTFNITSSVRPRNL